MPFNRSESRSPILLSPLILSRNPQTWSRLSSSVLQVCLAHAIRRGRRAERRAGGIGQPLSLLLKINPAITEVRARVARDGASLIGFAISWACTIS